MYDKDFGGGYDYGGPMDDMGGDYYGDPQPQQGSKMPSMPDFSGVKAPNMDISKFKPLIILGVILLIIAAAVFFFLSIQHTITFNIKEANGPELYARIDIKTLDGKRVYVNSNVATDKVNLWNGEYEITVTKSGYEPYTRQITIPDDAPEDLYVATLTKSLNATLSISTGNVASVYGTKSIPGTLTIQNNGPESFQGEIRAESDDLEVLFPSASKDVFAITLPGNTEQPSPTTISFDVAMKSAATASKNVSVKFIIGGTSITETVKFEANPSPEIEIKERELKNLRITAGDSFRQEITITNKSKFPARDLYVEVNADDCCGSMLNWFEFSQYDTEKYNAKINSLAKSRDSGDSAKLTLYVNPPITAKIGDTFRGRLVLDSETLEAPKSIIIQYEISSILKTNIELNTSTSPISVKTTLVDKTFTISNKGDIDVENVVLKVKNSNDCDITWLKFLADDDLDSAIEIGNLVKKSSSTVNVRLINGNPPEGKMDCELVVEYSDPINAGETLSESKFYIINYTPPETLTCLPCLHR